MPFRFRRRLKFGPFVLNISERGVSPALKAGPFTHNFKSGKTTTNLPDGAYHETRPKRRQAAQGHRCRCGGCGRFM